jgi:hypothetical protein
LTDTKPVEPDLKGLSREFVLKVMMKCAADHDGMHCHSGHRKGGAGPCENAIQCTIENCNEVEYIEDEDELIEAWAFVHNPGGGWHHKITTEMVSIVEVIDLSKYADYTTEKYYGSTHTIEMNYCNGTKHEWRALYGVNEEEAAIDCWMD